MPTLAEEKSALDVRRLSEPKMHAVGGVAGLHLNITDSGAKSWILRMTVGARRRDIGLGAFPEVSLADAREKARAIRAAVREQGIDPVAQKREHRSALIASQAKELTFKQCAARYIDIHSPGWKNAKHVKQWQSTLEQYAYPVMGHLPARSITREHVLQVLKPIWREKTETASRLRGRIENVMSWAIEEGVYLGLNPARLKDNLEKSLPSRDKIRRRVSHAALPVSALPEFMGRLRAMDGIAALALRFAILTAARSGEVRGATWDEVDLKAATWTVPQERMKAGKEHRVPLSSEALAVLRSVPRMVGSPLIFPAAKGGKLSDMALLAVVRRMQVDAVPHGFRSTFKDWCSETTSYPNDLSEMALAHTIANKVEAAYRRGDMFEKRRAMMEDWARYSASALGEKVVPISKAKKPKGRGA